MTIYRMAYGDDDAETMVTETFEGFEVEREDGWVVVLRDGEAVLRLQEQHVHAFDEVPKPAGS
jgi:hypothetical protein